MLSYSPNSPISGELTAGELALARQRTYAFLGRLYLEGVTAVTLPTVRAIPELAATMGDPFDADEAAAAHQSLFGFNIFPYESIFLDGSGLLGGAATAAVLTSYQNAGFLVAVDSTSPDHIGHELALLAHLSAAEADAWEDGLATIAQRMQARQQDFLQKHLLKWLLPLTLAIKEQKQLFYTTLADLTLALVHDHVAAVGPLSPPNTVLPALPSLLDDEKTGLKEIAAYLTTPPYSGIYLGRDDVARLARELNLPRGFGDRVQMMTNLLRAGVQYDTLPELISRLQTAVSHWQNEYTKLSSAMPILTPFAHPWQARCTATDRLLTQIETQLATAA